MNVELSPPRLTMWWITLLRHFAIFSVLLITALLSVGIFITQNYRAFSGMLVFIVSTCAVYALMLRARSPRRSLVKMVDALVLDPSTRIQGAQAVAFVALGVAAVHLTIFNGFSLPLTLKAETTLQAALIRMHLRDGVPNWMLFAEAFAVNALFPIGLLLAIVYRMKRLAVLMGMVGLLYAVCMMKKSGPIALVLPTVIYLLFAKQWVRSAIVALSAAAIVFFMTVITNPDVLRTRAPVPVHRTETTPRRKPTVETAPTAPHAQEAPAAVTRPSNVDVNTVTAVPVVGKMNKFKSVVDALLERMVVTPGDVAAKWFERIPEHVPYGMGCGYRFTAPFLGCSFQNYPIVLYDSIYPTHAALGLSGSVNAASMMTAYANFGMLGLAISGALHGILAWVLFVIFYKLPQFSPVINAPYVMFLSSGDLFTILFSGGWGPAVFLFLLLYRKPDASALKKAPMSCADATDPRSAILLRRNTSC